MNKFKQLCETLEAKIQKSYEEGVTLEEAERLAAEFLQAQLITSSELKKADLDTRMRKTGVKAIRAAVYLDTVNKAEKKPTEAAIEHTINISDIVEKEQSAFDKAEVEKDELTRYYNIFREGHIYYRGISKGKFE